jgi:Xaa-Pro aminopeptidase
VLPPSERLSQQELQRRYDLVRKKIKERGLNVLLVSGIRFVAAGGYLRYLTNWAEPFGGEVLILPAEGDPIFLARTGERALLLRQFLGMEALTGSTGAQTAQLLKKMGAKRVGLCGLKTMVAEFYVQVTTALPDVEFVEASDILDEARMIKSEEELHWARKSAELTDVAFQVFASLLRPGRREIDLFLEVEHAVKQRGAENIYFMMSADPKPVAKFLDLAFDTYESGDIVLFNAEISGPGGYYTQLERTFCLGKPTKELEAAYAACMVAQDRAKALLRPGTKAKHIFRAIVTAIEESGHKMGLHPGHSQGLDIFERPLIDANEETELAANMIVVLHPHVLLPSGGGVWIGETFLVTERGPEPLQRSPRELITVDKGGEVE